MKNSGITVSLITAVLPSKSDYINQLSEDVSHLKNLGIEWIVSFDGKPDDSKIPKEADMVLSRDHHRGVGPTRNEALKKASGDWIYPIDSDDRINVEGLLNVLPILQKTTSGWVATNRAWLLADGTTKTINAFKTKSSRKFLAEELILLNQDGGPVPHSNSVFFRTDLFLKQGGWPEFRFFEDVAAAWTMENDYPGEWLEDEVTLFRLWENNSTKSKDFVKTKKDNFLEVYRHLNNHRRRQGKPEVASRASSEVQKKAATEGKDIQIHLSGTG